MGKRPASIMASTAKAPVVDVAPGDATCTNVWASDACIRSATSAALPAAGKTIYAASSTNAASGAVPEAKPQLHGGGDTSPPYGDGAKPRWCLMQGHAARIPRLSEYVTAPGAWLHRVRQPRHRNTSAVAVSAFRVQFERVSPMGGMN